MIAPLSLQQLQQRFGGELVNGSVEFDAVCTDTRKLDAGALFVALRGESFDAHDFLADIDGKVLGVVTEKVIEGSKMPQWLVADTTVALGKIGLLCREQFQGTVIGITGSCGKTTVKEMLAAIFGQRHKVCVTRGNLNNHFGVPMTLFSLAPEDQVLIVEMGASGPNEIGYLCSIAKPQITAVNNVRPAHVEGFGSVDGIATAKGQIYTSLHTGGTAVVNADDNYANYWRGRMPEGVRTLEVGFGHQWAVHPVNVTLDASGCPSFDLVVEGVSHPVQLQLLGEHNVNNALVAAGCAFAAGIPVSEIAEGLGALVGVSGRMQSFKSKSGASVIDDSYNANPGSVSAAIELLAQREGKKIMVLGDMAELGPEADQSHREMGRLALERGIDQLFTLGTLSAAASIEFAAGHPNKQRNFSEREALIQALTPELDGNTTVLVKGSRSARMELVVQALTNGN
ncbi:UDP-N-acetylmuramoyl-tripeptide--D-alanyl-D-alanine ligase [Microbulbifer hydrolyticus]|uniref:UDP-N-acetylmuramoyl-tripeptide--D-alanyl-D-alanine ligase n=1 Tax=Microbulbifer hydrolyticus TaxID=48074 RepID=A0A6P1TAP6_9GAMM|nr:UDP-N-acetylmuramoyl-tripeptide--D-alanyl-D-alanine ligase [Microbulbifer hydrolyticus]MBB5212166.1 UDP-N-acetylmuramoyl-tripeptide--D-alanyl-D-alanine ligase [Microbulbifer hydrolyticus]QHQ39834.1 UDP-N-acetylmuramoyl-tripeptide--D-alanyl-D-alanine ligase [Microbulbifer hydrolyticus]